jgi:Asp-tRNA(Asn)/Glu-tRNA(Gln) amidotransferase A subunit family amidase
MMGVLTNGVVAHGDMDEAATPIRCAVVDLADQAQLSAEVRDAFEQAVETARAAGWRVERLSLDSWDTAAMRPLSLLTVEVEALAEHGAMLERQPSGFSASLRGMLQWAARQPHEKVANAYLRLKSAGEGLRRQLSGFDAVLTPTIPAPAFSFDAEAPVDQADFTVLANISGLAATAFPLGLGGGGLPLSGQIICASDARAIRLAGRLAKQTPPPSGYV